MQRRKTAALAAMTVLAAFACGDGVSMMGDAMVDAGQVLLDAGHELVDAGDAMTPDASAQPRTFEAECEPHVVERIVERATGETVDETTYYYAEAPAPGLSPESVVRALAVMCDREVFGVSPATCGGDYLCERTPVEPLRCSTATPELESGRVRVRCGTKRVLRRPDGDQVTGERMQTVRFVVE